eukprot:12715024-Alexandrium_andersonii.AAC.1
MANWEMPSLMAATVASSNSRVRAKEPTKSGRASEANKDGPRPLAGLEKGHGVPADHGRGVGATTSSAAALGGGGIL